MAVSQELLSMMACPRCKGGLKYEKERQRLVCNSCRLRFKVLKGDVPDMLLEDAENF